MVADLLITGNIFNGISLESSPVMIAVKDGRIYYAGSATKKEEFLGKNTKIIDSGEGIIIPAMTDAHAHASSAVDYFLGVSLYGLSSPIEYGNAIKEFIKKNPDIETIVGRGYLNGNFDKNGPLAEMLDACSRDRKIIMASEDGHSLWVNSKVLELSGITESTKEIPNGVIVRLEGTNQPSGWLKEKAMELIQPCMKEYTLEDYKTGILKYQEKALSEGIWLVYEPMFSERKDYDIRMQAFQELEKENKLKIYFKIGYSIQPEDDWEKILKKIILLRERTKGTHCEVQGIKIFMDGVMEGHTAFLREPYADTPGNCGDSIWEQNKLEALFEEAGNHNLTIHIHTIGDAAIDSALDAFEATYRKIGAIKHRDCLTHLQIVAEDQYERMQKLGIIAVVNPFWHFKDPSYYRLLEIPFLGLERADKQYPIQSFFENGIIVTQASDWPVSVPGDALSGLQIAVTRQGLENEDMEPLNATEIVQLEQMLCALTINGTYQLQMEEEYGSLTVSKKANFIMLDKNLFTIREQEISKCKVIATYIDGMEVYHQKSENSD